MPLPSTQTASITTAHRTESQRSRNAQLTREQVLRAAHKLFIGEGFAATTIRQIASEAGVSVGSVMAIGDKSSLLITVFDNLIESKHTSPAPAANQDATKQLISLVMPFVELFSAHLELGRTYASILLTGKHSSTIFTDLRARLIGEIENVLATHAPDTQYTSSSAPRRTHARTIYYVYLGALFAWASTVPTAPVSELYTELRVAFSHLTTLAEGN